MEEKVKRTFIMLLIVLCLAMCYGQMSFNDVAHGIPGLYNSAVAWGDYDGDGDLDALVAGKLLDGSALAEVFRNDSGVFVDVNAGIPGFENVSLAWGDYDNDGDLDIAITGLSNNVPTTKIYTNSNGLFSPHTNDNLPGLQLGSLAWGDYDNDGDLDLIFSGKNADSVAKTYLYKNDLGVFSNTALAITPVWNSSLAWGDADRDGDLDLFITGMGTAAVAELWKNTNGVLAKVTLASIQGLSLSSVVWGDYDNDGDLDLIMAGNRLDVYYTKVFRNDSSGTTIVFTDMAFGLPGVQNAVVKVGDMDNDGDLDLLLAGEQSSGSFITTIYRNNESVFYSDPISIPGIRAGSVSLGDYNSDHKLDILLTGMDVNGTPLCKVYQNQISAINTAPAAPTGLFMNVDPTDPNYLIFRWDPATDNNTNQLVLSYILRLGYSPGGQEISSPQTLMSGYRKVPQRGYATSNCFWRIKATAMPFGNFYWSVQAIDASFEGSPWAGQQSFNGGRVLAPNGGEILRAGTASTIYWYSFANSTNTNVYLSTNNGVEWNLLTPTPVLSSLGRLAIILPVVSSTSCLVKIEDTANPALFDVSDATFTITSGGPYIDVTSQATFCKLQVGNQYMITWSSSGVTNLKIELSIDEGQTWATLIPSVSAALGYQIVTIPNSVAPSCYFRLSSLENPSIFDWNNAAFSIVLLELLFPNLGDHVMTAPPTTNKINVSWTVIADGSNNITSVKIWLSLNNGATWTVLSAATAYLTGTFAGTIPNNTISAECLIRIEDASDASVMDISSGPFVIADLDVTSPNTAVRWMMGKTYPITWTQNGVVGLLKLQYSFSYSTTGTNWTTIAENLPANQGSYDWTVPVITATSFTTCRIRICRQGQDSFFDISDANFSVVYLGMISPLGGELWYSPPSRTVIWEAYGVSSSRVQVSLDSGVSWKTVVSSQSTGTGINNYTWNTAGLNSWSPMLPGDYENALLKISDTNTSAQDVYVITPAKFTLKQQLHIIYPPNPNAGSVEMPHVTKPLTLIRGSAYTILWKADPSIANISIHYQRGTGTVTQIVASTPCVPGTQYNALYGLPVGEQYCAYTWNIPAGLALGTNYRILIRRYPTLSPSIEDWSDNFSLADALPAIDFSAVPTEGYIPLDVQFTDLSPNGSAQILSWLWDFGDGSSSTMQNPLHTYTTAGSFSVRLTVTNNVDPSRTLLKENYIVTQANEAVMNLLTPTPLSFYARPGQTTGWQSVKFSNTGSLNLRVTSLAFENAGLGFNYEYPRLNQDIAPGTIDSLLVNFSPSSDTFVTTNLIITSNASNSPIPVAMEGNNNPVPPTGVTVVIVNESAVISWAPVTLSVNGSPVTPDAYIVEYNETAYEDDRYYYYLVAVPGNVLTYTHYLVARYEDQMFYRVRAVKDLTRAQLQELLDYQSGKQEKLRWGEMQDRLLTGKLISIPMPILLQKNLR